MARKSYIFCFLMVVMMGLIGLITVINHFPRSATREKTGRSRGRGESDSPSLAEKLNTNRNQMQTHGKDSPKINTTALDNPPVHQLPRKDEILRQLSNAWQNSTKLTEARIREVTKDIEDYPYKYSAADMRLFLRTSANQTVTAEIRKHVAEKLTRCQAMQIVRPEIPFKNVVFESDLNGVTKRNQADCVPVYDSCAIVGNSGILLGSQCGDVINSADFVIRNNMAVLGSRFAADVGTRTDVVSINLELIYALTLCTKTHKDGKLPPRTTCQDLRKRMEVFKKGNLFWFFKRYTKFFNEMMSMLAVLRNEYNLDFRLAYSPIIPMDAAKKLANVPVPSSGLAVYAAATQFCKSISLFGFYPYDHRANGSQVLGHYYDKLFTFSKNHKMTKEFDWLVEHHIRGAHRLINNCN